VKTLHHRAGLAALLACAALASGCATITGSESQNISVETSDNSGPVAGAECRLTNNNGSWTVKTPGVANVRRSGEDLLVRCESEDREPGTAKVVSRVNAALFGNVIFGGAIGAVIDHTRGTAYDYPTLVRVVFGASRVIEAEEVASSSPPVPAAAAPATAPRPQGRTTLNDLDGLLKKE
jgi:hypothetical protein